MGTDDKINQYCIVVEKHWISYYVYDSLTKYYYRTILVDRHDNRNKNSSWFNEYYPEGSPLFPFKKISRSTVIYMIKYSVCTKYKAFYISEKKFNKVFGKYFVELL